MANQQARSASEPSPLPQSLRSARDRLAQLPKQYGLDLIRIYLGLGLFARGAHFAMDPTRVMNFVQEPGPWMSNLAVAHYVAAAHLFGGLLLILGWYARLGALIQLPALIGALFFVHVDERLFSEAAGQSKELSALVLLLLLVFTLFGSGQLSLDHLLRKRSGREPEPLVPRRASYSDQLTAHPHEGGRRPPQSEPVDYHPGPPHRGPEGARTAQPGLAKSLQSSHVPERPEPVTEGGKRRADKRPAPPDPVDEAGEESFPASDPPSYTAGHA